MHALDDDDDGGSDDGGGDDDGADGHADGNDIDEDFDNSEVRQLASLAANRDAASEHDEGPAAGASLGEDATVSVRDYGTLQDADVLALFSESGGDVLHQTPLVALPRLRGLPTTPRPRATPAIDGRAARVRVCPHLVTCKPSRLHGIVNQTCFVLFIPLSIRAFLAHTVTA